MGDRTPLYDAHVNMGARMVDFGGWDMPVHYGSQIDEHNAVRNDAGMFDVSHMGRFEIRGPKAAAFLRHICTYDLTRLSPGQSRYAAVCRQDGRILDDVYVYCLATDRYMLAANAANIDKVGHWLREHTRSFEVEIFDVGDPAEPVEVACGRVERALAGVAGADRLLARSRTLAAGIHYLAGRLAEAEHLYRRTLARAETLGFGEVTCDCLNALGAVHSKRRQNPQDFFHGASVELLGHNQVHEIVGIGQ